MEREKEMGKTILVTGATGGIGSAIVEELIVKGYQIVAVARTERKLQDLVERYGDCVRYVVCDLSDMSNVAVIFQQLSEWNIVLSGAVYCAGNCTSEPIKLIDVDAMQRDMNINTLSFVEMGKFFSKKKYVCEGAGIVALSSMSAWDMTKGMCVYSMSKAALNVAVQTMAKELMKRKIRVNAILPAYVNTAMTIGLDHDQNRIAMLQKKQPLGIIEPKYIAYMAEFLLSEKAKYMTGCLIPISGGRAEK